MPKEALLEDLVKRTAAAASAAAAAANAGGGQDVAGGSGGGGGGSGGSSAEPIWTSTNGDHFGNRKHMRSLPIIF